MTKQMCHASADENGFVMSYDEAVKLLQETYRGSMQVTEDFRIGDWQAASHLYHGHLIFIMVMELVSIQERSVCHKRACKSLSNIILIKHH